MASIVIGTARKGEVMDRCRFWADVLMCVNSCTLYAPEHEVVVAWKGPCPPQDLLPNPRLRLVEQPASADSYGEAFDFACSQASSEELILLNDDAVLTPDTIDVLLEDIQILQRAPGAPKVGFLACRSNFVAGPQNIRAPNDGTLAANSMRYDSENKIIGVNRISPVCAYMPRTALEAIGGFPPINWFSDDLMCWDLAQKGYAIFISRSYVHHIGQRASTQGGRTQADLLREGQSWVRRHRPDFWKAISGGQDAGG